MLLNCNLFRYPLSLSGNFFTSIFGFNSFYYYFYDKMEDDFYVRKFIGLIFDKNCEITEDTTATDLSIPPCLLTKDFPLKLRRVLLTKQAFLSFEWKEPFQNLDYSLMPPVNYVMDVIVSCQAEHLRHTNIFEAFISVCSLVRYINNQTFQRNGLNYFDMNSDISMELYENFIRKSFLRRGGFLRLIEYIHRHKYLKLDLDMNDLAFFEDPSRSISEEVVKKLETEAKRERTKRKAYNKSLNIDSMQATSASMAKKIVASRAKPFSTSSGYHDVKNIENKPKQKEPKVFEKKRSINTNLKYENTGELSQGCSGSNSDSKSKWKTKQKEEIAYYHNIMEAVIKHNRSKSSDLIKSENPIQKRVEGILQRLKSKIKALIQVLDEDDEE